MIQLCILAALISASLASSASTSGFRYNSPYIDYEAGTARLIFSVPHGGSEEPESIPERTVCNPADRPYRGCHLPDGSCSMAHSPGYTEQYCQCKKSAACKVSHIKDSFTKEIAEGVRSELYELTGKKSYIVINNLKRNKMDGNRDKPEATFGVAEAELAWESYHERIRTALEATGGDALFIDFHGQAHKEGWTELGYALSKTEINSMETDSLYTHEDTTICQLVEKQCGRPVSRYCFENTLRGLSSMGHYLEEEVDENGKNYVTVPSRRKPRPGSASYFSGGYNVRTYGGCSKSNQVDAIQIEMPRQQRWVAESRVAYIKAVAKSIKKFMDNNYSTW